MSYLNVNKFANFNFYLQKHKSLLGAALAITVHNIQNIVHTVARDRLTKMKSCQRHNNSTQNT